jgi:hypothetical protein
MQSGNRRVACEFSAGMRRRNELQQERQTTRTDSSESKWVADEEGNSVAADVERNFRRDSMLWTIFVILLVLWLLGVVSSYTLGGFIHILLVIALVVLVIQLITGRRTV